MNALQAALIKAGLADEKQAKSPKQSKDNTWLIGQLESLRTCRDVEEFKKISLIILQRDPSKITKI